MPRPAETALLVPVKAFAAAKVRLAGIMDPVDRERLARALADGVLAAACGLPAAVVCDDAGVAEWAAERGALVIWTPARGLNAAVTDGVGRLRDEGAEQVVVAHADLPLVSDLSSVARPGHVVLAPDRRRDGTNVAAVPTTSGFAFSYGPGSFLRHRAEAERLGVPLEVLEREDLAWDVDVPDDLTGLPGSPAHPRGVR